MPLRFWLQINLVPRVMPVRGLGLALALGKRNEIRNFIGCREISSLGAAKEILRRSIPFPQSQCQP